MKRILSVVMILAMVLSIAGCKAGETKTETSATDETSNAATVEAGGDKATDSTTETGTDAGTVDTNSTEPDVYPTEKVLIGVEIYDPTESETLAIQKYFEYLSENFNVEFKYSEAIQDAEQEMKFIEDCAVAGCKGFYGIYNVSGPEQFLKVQELGMFFVGGTNERYEAAKAEPNYLGLVSSNGSDYDNGKALGEWVMKNGYKNIIYANGGADFGVGIFVDRQAGFMDAIDDSVNVTVVKGFPGDQFFADQAAALATPGIEAVVASFNGVDFWAQPIVTSGLDIKLATIGAINQDYLKAFQNNQLNFLVAGNIEAAGINIMSILNAIDGNPDMYKTDGLALYYGVPTFTVSSAEEIESIVAIQESQHIFSADDLKGLIKTLNPESNLDTLKALVDKSTMENILAK